MGIPLDDSYKQIFRERDQLAVTYRARRMWQAMAVAAVVCAAVVHLPAKEGNNKKTKADLTPLMVAASNCKVDEVKALLGQGADFKAVDGEGRDALTYASIQRTKNLALKCPEVVLALTTAGADPWAARYYQSPELTLHPPTKVAVLRVTDERVTADNKANIEKFANDVEEVLSQKHLKFKNEGFVAGIRVPVAAVHYPIMPLNETLQKLRAAGFSEEDVVHPDRKRACAILGTDAVFEAAFKGYSHADILVATATQASLEFWITDCRTGQLLWKNDPGQVFEWRGFIVRVFSGLRSQCEMAMTLPRYEGPEK